MGRLNVDQIQTNSGRVICPPDGQIVAMNWVFYDEYTNFSAPTSGNGTLIYPLAMTHGVQRVGNKIIFEYMLGGEATNNTSFTFLKATTGNLVGGSASLITDAGQEGYNADRGNTRDSGIICGWYDANNDTTPSNMRMTFHYTPPDTDPYVYLIGVRSSTTSAGNYRLNRYYTTADEFNTSFGMLWEIAG